MSVVLNSDTDLDSDFSTVTTVWVGSATIPPNFFTDQRFPNLSYLHVMLWIERNKSPLVVQSSSLEKLLAANIGIEQVILDCPNLTNLNISNNEIRSLLDWGSGPGSLGCPSLKYLICSHNMLTDLSLEIASLEVLDCSVNRLSKLHLECPSLRQLHCVYNQLSELPLDLPFLERLSCSHNPLQNLHGLEFSSSLRELSCPSSLAKEAKMLKDMHLPDLQIRTSFLSCWQR